MNIDEQKNMDTNPQNQNVNAPIETPAATVITPNNGGNVGGIIAIIIIIIIIALGGLYFYMKPTVIQNDVEKMEQTESTTDDEDLSKEFEASGDVSIEGDLKDLDEDFK